MSAEADEEAETAAERFLAEGLVTEATTAAWVESGSVPIVVGSDRGFAGSEEQVLLENTEELFGLTRTPQQFAEAVEAAGAAGPVLACASMAP